MKKIISMMITTAMLLSLCVTATHAETFANPIINVYSEPFDGTGANATYYKPSGYDVYKVSYTTEGIDTSEDYIVGLQIKFTIDDSTKVASKTWSKAKLTGGTVASREQNGTLLPYGVEPATVGVGGYAWSSVEGIDCFDWDTYPAGGTQETLPLVDTLIYVTEGESVTFTYTTAFRGADPTSQITVIHNETEEVKYNTALQYKINGVVGNTLTLGESAPADIVPEAADKNTYSNASTGLKDADGEDVVIDSLRSYGAAKFDNVVIDDGEYVYKVFATGINKDTDQEETNSWDVVDGSVEISGANVSFIAIVRSATHTITSVVLKAFAK